MKHRAEVALEMDNPLLMRKIKSTLIPPSAKSVPYNLTHPEVEDPSEREIAKNWVLKILLREKLIESTTGGVFFEAGALDGERSSKSLYLERFQNWTGLLVEMTGPNLELLKRKRRKAWIAPVCVSPERRPLMKRMRFVYDPTNPWEERTGTISRVKWTRKNEDPPNYQTPVQYIYTVVNCYPLYSLLAAAGLLSTTTHDSGRSPNVRSLNKNNGRIDFLSLDLEGVELQVLKTLPWKLVNISMVVIDAYHVEEGREAILDFMKSIDFTFAGTIRGDLIFFKKRRPVKKWLRFENEVKDDFERVRGN